ncbi:MAG: isoprenylcysteine carboxylmethyltransferase family protein [Methanoregula sp.]|jgi:protein-S-isoprenylcysteine O-methyltransferase Ste14|uniref:methyltransferase family protein n=1 Tax=Methanoregula sp. TaxID=2052170 RepID=UPI003D13E907
MQTGESLFFTIWIAFYAYWLISAWKTRSPVKRKLSGLSYFLYGIVWVALCIFLLTWLSPDIMAVQVVPSGIGFTIAGLLITVAGLAFAIWARVHLGKNWSGMPTIREEHTITRTGPYRFVRHPIYSGLILALTGTAIGIGYFLIFCCVLLVFGLLVIKFRMEEKFLEEEFGEEYARYKREVKALIPYVI